MYINLYTCIYKENTTWPEVFYQMRDILDNLKSVHLDYLYDISQEPEARGWSLACADQRPLIEKACRWIVGNGELGDEDREGFEVWKFYWEHVAKIGLEVQSVDNIHV